MGAGTIGVSWTVLLDAQGHDVVPAELDRVVTGVLGPRWATGGPFLSFHLGGGDGGLRHLLEHLGPGLARRWADLGKPDLDAGTIEAISTATGRLRPQPPCPHHRARRALAARSAAQEDAS